MKQFTARISTIKQVSPETYIVTFSLGDDTLDFIPGQYMIMKIPQEGKVVNRLYSIASSNNEHHTFELFIKRVEGGVGSLFLTTSPIGTPVECVGPAGLFTLRNTPLNKVFMTTGTGFAPVRSFLQSLKVNPSQKWLLLWGDPKLQDVGLMDELVALQNKLPSFSFYACLSREEGLASIPAQFRNNVRLGRINAVFDTIKPALDVSQSEFYLCGSRAVVEGMRTYLSSLGLPPERLIFEKY